MRRLEGSRGPGEALYGGKQDSCAGTLDSLVGDEGVSLEAIEAALSKQTLEIVLTAHPTEVHRRTVLAKHRRVAELLAELPSASGSRAGTKRHGFFKMRGCHVDIPRGGSRPRRGVPRGYSDGQVAAPPRGATWIFPGTAPACRGRPQTSLGQHSR